MNPVHDKRLRSLAVLLSAVACLALPSIADEPAAAQEPAELKTLRIEYRQRLVKARTPADELYRGQLRSLLERYKRAGNLDASVAVQAEMQNPDPTQPVPPDKPLPPDLAGIRSAYLVNATRQAQPVEGWYRQQLQMLERTLVQKGDIAGARVVRGAIDNRRMVEAGPTAWQLEMMDLSRWTTPYGGKLKIRDGVLSFSDGGTMKHQGALAVFAKPLRSPCVITGAVYLGAGSFGGLVLGDASSMRYALFNTFPESKKEINLNISNGDQMEHMSVLPIEWRASRWLPFRVAVTEQTVSISIDESHASAGLPSAVSPSRFGLIVYESGSILLRNLDVLMTERRAR
jgi:hypothetical protein